MAADVLPRVNRGSGFGVLAANGLGDVISSVVVGALWSALSPAAGFAYAAFFTALGAVLILWLRADGQVLPEASAA